MPCLSVLSLAIIIDHFRRGPPNTMERENDFSYGVAAYSGRGPEFAGAYYVSCLGGYLRNTCHHQGGMHRGGFSVYIRYRLAKGPRLENGGDCSFSNASQHIKSGSRGLLPAPSPLGTVHATFTAHGSSISKGNPCEAARLCHFLVASIFIRRSRTRLSEIIFASLIMSASCKVSGVFRHVRVGCGPDFHMSANTNGTDPDQLIDFGRSL